MIVFHTLQSIIKEASLTGLDNPVKAASLQKMYRHTFDYIEKFCKEHEFEPDEGYLSDPSVFRDVLQGPITFVESTIDLQTLRNQFSQYDFTSMAMVFDETAFGGNDIGACVYCLYLGDGGNFMAYVPKVVAESDQLFMVTLKEHEINVD